LDPAEGRRPDGEGGDTAERNDPAEDEDASLSRSVARLLLAAPVLLAVRVLLAVPVSEGAFEPQPALITLIRATIARRPAAAAFYSWLLLGVWKLVDTGHCCILGSCVGSAYIEGQP
jgi:hypothetical protein